MSPSLLLTLAFCIGAAAGAVALLPAVHAARAAGWREAREGVDTFVADAFQRGKAAGWNEMSRALIRDMGPDAARQLADRMAAMDKVEAITRGERT